MTYTIYENERQENVKKINVEPEIGEIKSVKFCTDSDDAQQFILLEHAQSAIDALREYAEEKGKDWDFEIVDETGMGIEY